MRKLKLFLVCLVLVGCGEGLALIEAARVVVNTYCALPERARVLNRGLIARAIQPHRLELHCGGENAGAD